MNKERLDQLLVRRGLAGSRERAQRLIMAGAVRCGGQVLTKAGRRVAEDTPLEVAAGPRFVSRGGDKMEAAFEAFDLDIAGRTCLDVGSSTGGFSDCLLQHGAARIYAVDVGKGQLHWKLRNDPRMVVMEQTNARYIKPDQFPEKPDFVVADVSFISLTKVLPPVIQVLTVPAELVVLVKPQFEAGREQVEKGGVVRDPDVHAAVIDRIRTFGESELGLTCRGVIESPLRGPAGNIEFLVYWRTGQGDGR